MWLRQEKAPAAKPAAAADSQPDSPAAAPAADLAAVRERSGREMSRIGKSLRIRGELTGSEDLHVDGEIDGEIELHDSDLLIGPNGSVRARAKVRSFIVWGNFEGQVLAAERVEIHKSASLTTEMVAACIVIEDAAGFRGSAEILQPETDESTPPPRAG